jgi:hypothetical protein
MSCFKNDRNCGCNFNIKTNGLSDVSAVTFDGADRTVLNWSEISVPELLAIPNAKPDIENIDQIFVEAKVNCARLIETPYSFTIYNLPLDIAIIPGVIAILDTLLAIDITPIIDAVTAILAIPGLDAVPLIGPLLAALSAALVGVETAFDALIVAVNAAVDALTDVLCIGISVFVSLINAVIVAANLLITALEALQAAADALAAFTAAIPVIGAAVAAAVLVLDAAIDAVITIVEVAVTALLAILVPLPVNTQVLVINPNAEDTCLTGRKIVIEGVLKQKVIYTGLVIEQSVHSASFNVPFNTFVVPYANFVGLTFTEDLTVLSGEDCETIVVDGFPINPTTPIVVDVNEIFDIETFIEDIFVTSTDPRTIFKNITLFFRATPCIPVV